MIKILSKIIILALFMAVSTLNGDGQPFNIESRFVGMVTDIKILDMDDQKNVTIWVSADRNYQVVGKNQIPTIYVNDSLFEYWINYRLAGVGTHRNYIIYQIK